MTYLYRLLGVAGLLATRAVASQPSAPAPIEAPMRPLPWGTINFLQTTDTHGWHAGHLQEAQYSADWGDYISFANRMRERADKEGVDVLLVDTGDRIEGNGLFDASDPKGVFTYEIFKEQDIDIICIGNHELYQPASAASEYNKTVPNFKGKYIASNLDYIDPATGKQVPMAQRYRKFTTKNQGIRIVAFGFLFDFTGNANNTVVQPVDETIKEKWFQEAIREDVDLFVVIGHVMLDGPEYKALYKAIRGQNWDTPIQFFGGHSHIRNYAKYDSRAYGVQAGRYMETLGWMSIDGLKGKGESSPLAALEPRASLSFKRRYIDNNLYGFHYHTGLNESTFPTEHGKNVSVMIREARKSLDLDHSYGCAPKDLWLNRAEPTGDDSLLPWLSNEVLPDVIVQDTRRDVPRLAILNTGAMRFDIFEGNFTRDTTFIVSPFVSKFQYIKDVPYSSAKQVFELLNGNGSIMSAVAPALSYLAPPEQLAIHSDFVPEHLSMEHPFASAASDAQLPLSPSGSKKSNPQLIPGYTTSDAAGNDGDDTVHSPITFYRVPNVIQSEIAFPSSSSLQGRQDPETVDVIFIDFITPWVLVAMKFAGQNYTDADVELYRDETFTELMVGWIERNWEAC